MLKHIYRVIILIVIFTGALIYFGRNIKEVKFNYDNTTQMKSSKFPLITIKKDNSTINMLHGYSTNMAANLVRESVIPLGTDKTFAVQFGKGGPEIKKLNYELREFVGNTLIESNSISVFEENEDKKSARIKLNSQLTSGKEYAVKITLITSKSQKIYYYQRIKIYDVEHLKEILDFIQYFQNTIINKNKAEDIIKYLEPLSNADNSSLSYVNIHSSFDLVCWGKLKPVILTDIIPTVKEVYQDSASVELNYYIEAKVAGATERYHVTEFYRVAYSPDRMYLRNYERHMEAIFDTSLASLSKSEFKLGITSDKSVNYIAGEDPKKLAFIRNKDLYFYDMKKNEITRVFSFKKEEPNYLRDYYDQHDIRLLDMDKEGNIHFLVYGYMNRGQYEGRVGVILYHYIRAEQRIEEMVYIPAEEPYQSLKENIGELCYINANNIFYIQMYDTIYAYNLTTGKISEIATDIRKNQVVMLKDIDYAVWQENSNLKKSKNISIMNLESGKTESISAENGYNIRLLDMIDNNIIYGFVREDDITSSIDGSIFAPLSTVNIASVDKTILKNYKKKNYYVTGITVKDNVVELRRVKKSANGTYESASKDYIMNQEESKTAIIDVHSRVSEQALTEYYMSLPTGFVMEKVPKSLYTTNTIISKDPTIRLPEREQKHLYYYPYIPGGIAGAYEKAADAIEKARDGIGVVVNSNQQLVWERGIRLPSYSISRLKDLPWSPSSSNTVASCLKLVLEYQGITVSMNQLNTDNSSAYDIFKKHSKYTPVRLTGITLDDALYYVSEGRPVIAMTDSKKAVIIYGYDAFNIMVIDPTTSIVRKMGIQDSTNLFDKAGNVFLSYLEE